jgi:hypothetical protein
VDRELRATLARRDRHQCGDVDAPHVGGHAEADRRVAVAAGVATRDVAMNEYRRSGRPGSPIETATPEQIESANTTTGTDHEIQQRAPELFEARSRESGCDLDDWLQAEGGLRPRRGASTYE